MMSLEGAILHTGDTKMDDRRSTICLLDAPSCERLVVITTSVLSRGVNCFDTVINYDMAYNQESSFIKKEYTLRAGRAIKNSNYF